MVREPRRLVVRPGSRLSVPGFAAAVVGPGLVTALSFVTPLEGKQGVASLFAVTVIVATVLGGFWSGIAAAMLSMVGFAYFYVEPFRSFDIASGAREGMVLSAVTFVLTSFVVDQAVERHRLLGRRVREAAGRLDETQRALMLSEERFRTVLESVGVAAWIWDIRSGEIDWPTPLILRRSQARKTPPNLESFFQLIHPDDRELVRSRIDDALATGRYEAVYRVVGRDGGIRWVEAEGEVTFEDGRPARMMGIARDVTERKQNEDALAFLADASAELAGSLDYERTLRRVARLAVPRLADCCVADVVEPGRPAQQLAVHQVAVAHVDEERERLVRELESRFPSDPGDPSSVVGAVLRDGEPLLVEEVDADYLAAIARDPEHLQALESLQLASIMVVPLAARGRVLGALTFLSSDPARPYEDDDVAVALDLARQAALAIDNARLYRQRSEIARTLQRSLLPPALPDVPGVELAARYRAATATMEVGGDFYDVFEAADGRWAVAVGDVCGKGARAAALTGLARHTMRAGAMRERRPSRVLATLNDAILRSEEEGTFCTVALVSLERADHGAVAEIACGGHPQPFVVRAGGEVSQAGAMGTLLGAFPDPELADERVELAPGDSLVLYTDGLSERPGMTFEQSIERLTDVLRSWSHLGAEEIAEKIEQWVSETDPETPRDDVALLVLRVTPAGDGV